MNKRMFLIGLAGGLLTGAALRYPLYDFLPSGFVEGWPGADSQTALYWTVAAAVLLLLTGALAARFSGTSRRVAAAGAGAAAGVTAALLAEILIGGAAAGVWGSRLMLAHGLHATKDEAEFISLLTHGVVSTVWWTYASIWIATAAGLILGALGGLIAGPGGKPARPAPEFWLAFTGMGILGSALSLIVMVAVYALLGPMVQKAAEQQSIRLPYPSETILYWPLATNLVWLLFWQVAGWLVLRTYPLHRNTGILFKTIALLVGGMALIGPLYFYTPLFAASFAGMPEQIKWTGLSIGLGLAFLLGTVSMPEAGGKPTLLRAWDAIFALGDARRAAIFYMFLAVAAPFVLFQGSKNVVLIPWCALSLTLGVVLAALGLNATKKYNPAATEKFTVLPAGEFFRVTSLGGLFAAILAALNSLASLSLVLIPVVMIAVLMLHNEADAAKQIGAQTLTTIVQTNYSVPANIPYYLAGALIVLGGLATGFKMLFEKMRARYQTNIPQNPTETK